MRRIISILLQNEAGALARVAGMFSARGYNIDSLTVATTHDPSVSRLTLVTFGDEAVAAVREYAEPLKEAGCDTVILGCTHYPLLRPVFQRTFGREVTLVFSAEETAREVAETLARKGIENEAGREGVYRFLTTGDPAAFREMGRRFLQLPIGDVEHVTLQELSAV